jgi:hypothetical protein
VFKKQFSEVEDACALAQAMVDTVREPLIVLDKDLRVIAASRSFYVKFATNPDDSKGKHLYELGDGEWDIPRLRTLLENIIPEHGTMNDYVVEHDFPHVGKRVLLLNACIVLYEKAHENILLSILPSNAPWNTTRMNCCGRKTCFCMKSSTASPTASRSSPASSC